MREFIIILGCLAIIFWAACTMVICAFALQHAAWLLLGFCTLNLVTCWLAINRLVLWLPDPQPEPRS